MTNRRQRPQVPGWDVMGPTPGAATANVNGRMDPIPWVSKVLRHREPAEDVPWEFGGDAIEAERRVRDAAGLNPPEANLLS